MVLLKIGVYARVETRGGGAVYCHKRGYTDIVLEIEYSQLRDLWDRHQVSVLESQIKGANKDRDRDSWCLFYIGHLNRYLLRDSRL